ncbi:MAG: hypothetical protein AABX05_01570, partial [Nanoarchaeota archaeon]
EKEYLSGIMRFRADLIRTTPPNIYKLLSDLRCKMVEENLHKEVVTGIVQVIKFLEDKRKEGVSSLGFGELFKAGFRGRTEGAKIYICEFVKDGVVNLRQEDIDAVVKGDYGALWSGTNTYFKRLGYDPVNPEPIFPDFITK